MLRRRPFAFVGGLILLFLTLPAGYLYWDYASHFESSFMIRRSLGACAAQRH